MAFVDDAEATTYTMLHIRHAHPDAARQQPEGLAISHMSTFARLGVRQGGPGPEPDGQGILWH
jgi:hypothetical protein